MAFLCYLDGLNTLVCITFLSPVCKWLLYVTWMAYTLGCITFLSPVCKWLLYVTWMAYTLWCIIFLYTSQQIASLCHLDGIVLHIRVYYFHNTSRQMASVCNLDGIHIRVYYISCNSTADGFNMLPGWHTQ